MNYDQMTDNPKDNIILFPKTIEYYQIQLTRMLESERYEEAVQLLEFLLNCKGEHTAVYEEWSMLLEWLQTQLSDMEWQDVTEDDLIDENIRNKIKQDHLYIERLLDTLKEDCPIENQIFPKSNKR